MSNVQELLAKLTPPQVEFCKNSQHAAAQSFRFSYQGWEANKASFDSVERLCKAVEGVVEATKIVPQKPMLDRLAEMLTPVIRKSVSEPDYELCDVVLRFSARKHQDGVVEIENCYISSDYGHTMLKTPDGVTIKI